MQVRIPVAVLLLARATFTTAAEPLLRVEDAWLREAPPVAAVQAAYGRFCNDGVETVTLAAAHGDAFGRIEMHETVETTTTASMRRLNGVVIEPGQCADFAPGGRHFMLFDPARPLRAGDSVTVTLVFADGFEQDFTLPVRRGDEENLQEHGHHAHD